MLSKAMMKRLERYHVALRDHPTLVTHATYRTQTVCDPDVFAMFEGAVKSQWCAFAVHLDPAHDVCRWNAELGRQNGFAMPTLEDAKRIGVQRATEDIKAFSKAIADRGLYRQLLD